MLYRLDGKQRSVSFEDFESADAFKKLADKFGPALPDGMSAPFTP